MKNRENKKGFTLIEILIVIGLIAILATIVLVALNPARQFAQGRNSQRTSNVSTILNAYGQRVADNKGLFGVDATCSATMDIPVSAVDESSAAKICKVGSAVLLADCGSTTVDMRLCLAPTYVPELPVDPKSGEMGCLDSTCAPGYDTGYFIWKDTNSRVTVMASSTELGVPKISVTR